MGHRVTGDPRDTVDGAGWEFLFVAVDDHARIGFTQMKRDERQDSAIAFLHASIAYFTQLGVAVRRVLTDNGSAFRSKHFAAACRRLGVKHDFPRPYRPQTNGKAERFIQPALREWAYGIPYRRSHCHARALDPPLQLASATPRHRRYRTHVPPQSQQKQPLDASQLAGAAPRAAATPPGRAASATRRPYGAGGGDAKESQHAAGFREREKCARLPPQQPRAARA
jgi:transposase InsO family protein